MIEERNPTLKEKHLEKSPISITGFDDITDSGLPNGHATLVDGSAGSGKTLIAMEFLVKGAKKYDEPGVFMAFGEKNSHRKGFTNF
jgi:circadian clock protein KaiC